jgi:hypothetical protein
VRTNADPSAIVPSIRDAIRQTDAEREPELTLRAATRFKATVLLLASFDAH